jgi:xanthine/uracil permease
MKIIKIFRSTIISFIVIIIAAILGFVVWAKLGTYPAKDVAIEALKSTDLVSISQDKWIVITPNEETNTGLIFYPGGLVEPTAYTPVIGSPKKV